MKSLILGTLFAIASFSASAGEWIDLKTPNVYTKFDGDITDLNLVDRTVSIEYYAESSDYSDGIFRSYNEEQLWTIYAYNTNTGDYFYIEDTCNYEDEADGRGVLLWCDYDQNRHTMKMD